MLRTVDVIARICRQKRPHTVAAAILELRVESLGPVAGADFIAVYHAIDDCRTDIIAQIIKYWLDTVLPVVVCGCGAHLVDFKSPPPCHGRMIFCSRSRMAYAKHHPLVLGSMPRQGSVSIHSISDIYHISASDNGRVPHRGRIRLKVITNTTRKIFIVQIADTLCADRTRESKHGNVFVEVAHGFRTRQHNVDMASAPNMSFRKDHLLHGLFGSYPRTAGIGPSGRIVKTEFEPQTRRFGSGKAYQTEPMLAEICRGAFRITHIHTEYLCVPDPRLPHGLKIGCNAFARHIAVEPVPPCASTGFGRRRGESFIKRRNRTELKKSRQRKDKNTEFLHLRITLIPSGA